MFFSKCKLLFFVLLFCVCSSSHGQSPNVIELGLDNFEDLATSCTTSTYWLFHTGDNADWANPDFDDADWTYSNTFVTKQEYKDSQNRKHGWYRLHLKIDSTLWGEDIAINYGLIGAFEIYLNGKLIHTKGKVGTSAETEIVHYASDVNSPVKIKFDSHESQILAVKFSGFSADFLHSEDIVIGFILRAAKYIDSQENYLNLLQSNIKNQMFFTGLSFAFGLLHLLMFLFYKRVRENLYFALFTFSCAILSYVPVQMIISSEITSYLKLIFLFKLSLIGLSVFSIKVLYSIFYKKQPSYFKYIVIISLVALVFHSYLSIQNFYVIVIIFFIELVRIIAVIIYQKRKFAWIIGLGFSMFLLFSGYQMLIELIGLPTWNSDVMPYLVGIMSLIVSISVYIANSISTTNSNLEQKLVEVKELSEKTIRQEVASKLLKKDIEHKDKLLEESKRLENALHDLEITHKKLQNAEERAKTIIDASPVPLIVSRIDNGIILYANKHLGRLVGYSVEELIGKKSPDFYADPNDRIEVIERLKRDGILDNYEVAIKYRDGSFIWCIFSLVATKIDDDEVIIGGLYNITERKEAEEKLKAANLEIRQKQTQLIQSEKMASLGQLVAGVAHEINNPMGAIMSIHKTQIKATEKLKDHIKNLSVSDKSTEEDINKYLKIIDSANEVIVNGSERVSEIVRRLKSFARLDEAELQEVDIVECIDDTLNLIHHQIKNDITVNKSCQEIPKVACYPGQLNQVLLNLLINAKHALEGNKEKGEILISTIYIDNRVLITIEDNGMGIPPENIKKIFDPGFTTKGVGVGTGLGLSICYQIIKEHRGEIKVESKVGYGTIFVIDLPTNLIEILENEANNK